MSTPVNFTFQNLLVYPEGVLVKEWGVPESRRGKVGMSLGGDVCLFSETLHISGADNEGVLNSDLKA